MYYFLAARRQRQLTLFLRRLRRRTHDDFKNRQGFSSYGIALFKYQRYLDVSGLGRSCQSDREAIAANRGRIINKSIMLSNWRGFSKIVFCGNNNGTIPYRNSVSGTRVNPEIRDRGLFI